MTNSIIGQKFGRLTVVEKTDKKIKREFLYECICECGETTLQSRQALNIGHVRSCGCLQREQASEISKK